MKTMLVAAVTLAGLAGASAANAQECRGGWKELGNHVTVRCDIERSMGLYASAPRHTQATTEAQAASPAAEDDSIITGSIDKRRPPVSP